MALEGYKRQTGKRDGGILRIAVAEADAVEKVSFDIETGNVGEVQLSQGETFALYHFREDTAHLVERTETTAYFPLVKRELSFVLGKLDENEKKAAAELLLKSASGFIVIAMNGCGTSFLLGYSRRLGSRFPMKLRTSVADTGSAPEDEAAETLVFYNEDAEKAPVFTGEFPSID